MIGSLSFVHPSADKPLPAPVRRGRKGEMKRRGTTESKDISGLRIREKAFRAPDFLKLRVKT